MESIRSSPRDGSSIGYQWGWWVVGWVGVVVDPKIFVSGASSKIYDVLTEDGALLHVLPLTVHLKFYGQVGQTILDHSYQGLPF